MKNYSPRYPTYRPRSVRRAEKKAKKNILISIVIVVVLGFILLNWGIPFLIGSLTAFNKLKPADKSAVQETIPSEAVAPPVLNIPFEATNSATITFTGYAAKNSQVEIYVNDELKATVPTSEDGSFTADNISLTDGQNYIYGRSINPENQKSLASKTIRILFSSQKPKLEVSEPSDGIEIKGGDKKVNVSGITDPNNLISVNDQTAIVNADGSFSLGININEGDNTISILATSPIGNITKVERKVRYTP